MTIRTAVPRPERVMRLLIHPIHDAELFGAVVRILDAACEDHPDHWDQVTGEPTIIDHYGYHDDTLSSVVLGEEPAPSQYWQLRLRPGRHPIFDDLVRLVAEHYGLAS